MIYKSAAVNKNIVHATLSRHTNLMHQRVKLRQLLGPHANSLKAVT